MSWGRILSNFAVAFPLGFQRGIATCAASCDLFIPTPPSPASLFFLLLHSTPCGTSHHMLSAPLISSQHYIPSCFFLSKLHQLSVPFLSVRLGNNSPLLTTIIKLIIKINVDYLTIQSRSSANQCTFFQVVKQHDILCKASSIG